MEYILDTNTCIYIIKQKPTKVFDRFKTLPLGVVGISTITLAELQFGVAKSMHPHKNQTALNHFLIPLEILNFDLAATIAYGEIRTQLEKKVIL
jgi:tRNA(fMet)-specific endonuclease VapC